MRFAPAHRTLRRSHANPTDGIISQPLTPGLAFPLRGLQRPWCSGVPVAALELDGLMLRGEALGAVEAEAFPPGGDDGGVVIDGFVDLREAGEEGWGLQGQVDQDLIQIGRVAVQAKGARLNYSQPRGYRGQTTLNCVKTQWIVRRIKRGLSPIYPTYLPFTPYLTLLPFYPSARLRNPLRQV